MSIVSAEAHPAEPVLRPPEDAPVARRRQERLADALRRPTRIYETARRPAAVEIAFLAHYGVPPEALTYATLRARIDGVSADALLLAENIVAEDVFYRALADHLRVPFLETEATLAPGAAATAGQGYVPLPENPEGLRWLFAPTGAGIFRLMSVVRATKGRPLFALTTPRLLTGALRRARPMEDARRASLSAERADSALCVRGALGLRARALATAAVFGVVGGLLAPFEGVRLVSAFLLVIASLAAFFCVYTPALRASGWRRRRAQSRMRACRSIP